MMLKCLKSISLHAIYTLQPRIYNTADSDITQVIHGSQLQIGISKYKRKIVELTLCSLHYVATRPACHW